MAKISGNGLCLVEAVRKALNKDLGIKNSKNAQAKKIWLEIKKPNSLLPRLCTRGNYKVYIKDCLPILKEKGLIHTAHNRYHASCMCYSPKCEHKGVAK